MILVRVKIMTCAYVIVFLCLTVLNICLCRPTNSSDIESSYDTLNITFVTDDKQSSVKKMANLTQMGSIATENKRIVNATEYENNVMNYTTMKNQSVSPTNSRHDSEIYTPKKELPMGMIIAGPAAAFGIILFLCLSYYCHSAQLNRQAKILSLSLYVSSSQDDDSSECSNELPTLPTITTPQITTPRIQKLSTASLTVPRMQRDSSLDAFSTRRKSTLAVPSVSVPGNLHHKRGGSWSALADQELLNLAAPRRHSTFIL